MNVQELLLGPDDLDVERLDDETLLALATYEGDLAVTTSAIIELGGRPAAHAATLQAAQWLLSSNWADKYAKSAAIDAAFRADPLAAVRLAADVLHATREPLLLDAMIRGVVTEPGVGLEHHEFAKTLRAVAATVAPDGRCDGEMWQAFLDAAHTETHASP